MHCDNLMISQALKNTKHGRLVNESTESIYKTEKNKIKYKGCLKHMEGFFSYNLHQ